MTLNRIASTAVLVVAVGAGAATGLKDKLAADSAPKAEVGTCVTAKPYTLVHCDDARADGRLVKFAGLSVGVQADCQGSQYSVKITRTKNGERQGFAEVWCVERL